MKINVKIHRTFEGEKNLKAVASAYLNDEYAVHNIKVIMSENGLYVAMPNVVYTDKNGNTSRKDMFHPITNEAREELQYAVLTAYSEAVTKA